MSPTLVEGVNGPLNVFTAFRDPQITSNLVMVPPNTRAPKLGNPSREKAFIFIVEGSATFTNGEYYERVTPGQMIVIEAGEDRAYQTEKDRLIALEIRFAATPKPTTPVQVAVPLPSTEAPKKPSVTFEV